MYMFCTHAIESGVLNPSFDNSASFIFPIVLSHFAPEINGVSTPDTSNVFYAIRAIHDSNETSYYIIGIENGAIKYYRTKKGQDYSEYLKLQSTGGANAFELSSPAELITAQTLGASSLTHKKYRWIIQVPEIPTHAGYNGGLRRQLATLTYDARLPKHNRLYHIRHAHLSDRILGIFRQPAATSIPLNEGILTATYPGNYFETLNGNSMNTVFQCYYDEPNDKYYFLDYKYLQDNTTGSTINTAYQVYIGESNVFHLNWGAVLATPSTNTAFELIENTPTNLSNQAAYTDPDLFLLKNNGTFVMVNNAWAASQGPENDSLGSLDPITYSNYNLPPDYWGLFRFEEIHQDAS